LNAASFEIDLNTLETVKDLPFVYKISPVAVFIRPAIIETTDDSQTEGLKVSPEDTEPLNYGQSYVQNQMINVPAMHLLGYNGQGVIVAMFDGGFRKSHTAFTEIVNEGRLLDEWDFVFNDGNTQNEAEDTPTAQNHGTSTWSTLGGYEPGTLIGPAYGASFLLAKTEDVRSETVVEEDNWVAALEWVDSLGADIISASLGYSDWYTYSDYDGVTAITSAAASTAAALGIIVCNSMGNSGPDSGTLTAPADAFDIVAVGALSSSEIIASFSSRGPTYDGRTKPEVCAMGVSTRCAEGTSDTYYTYKSGTSLSTPMIGGACAVLLSANPALTPLQVRKALMETADNADSPNNAYGWGVADALQAFNWGANFTAGTAVGEAPLTVNFQDSSSVSVISRVWYFGDGDSSTAVNPVHVYDTPGSYDVTLTVVSASDGTLTRLKEGYITVTADTLTFVNSAANAGDTATMSINLVNSQTLNSIIIPVKYDVNAAFRLVQYSSGSRTKSFDVVTELYNDTLTGQLVFQLTADTTLKGVLLSPGSGEVARLLFEIAGDAEPGSIIEVDSGFINSQVINLSNQSVSYGPVVYSGEVAVISALRGDADNSGAHNILDVIYLINYLYRAGPAPISFLAGDADSSGSINLLDIVFL
ncbi:MAG: S8 family serine peptidase, partial [Candidatus Zixiibacteriota bacterium]